MILLTRLSSANILIQDWSFADGASPPSEVLNNWRNLIKQTFSDTLSNKTCIGVHCVAGLGRYDLTQLVSF